MEDNKTLTQQNAGEVQVTATDILKNEELMKQILESDAVKSMIQSEADRARTKATKEKESALSEFAKYKQETDLRIAELSEFQKNYTKVETLKKTGLDIELWDYVTGNTTEEIVASATSLQEKIAKLAQAKVGSNPQITSFTGLTKESFGKMSYAEKAKLYQTDRELYNQLKK